MRIKKSVPNSVADKTDDDGFLGFLLKKNIEISAQRYLFDALSAMALGLFATLLIGLIIKTLGEQCAMWIGENALFQSLIDAGAATMGYMGAGIGVAVSMALKAPMYVVVCGAVTGMMGAQFGGPAGAYVAAVLGCEFGKAVHKETKLDIIVTPAVSILIGFIIASTIGPVINSLMTGLGSIIMAATAMQPFFMGIIISVIMGLVLTAPISSAALAIVLNLSGIAAGAATVGCCAQMIGFAVISWRDNGVGGLVAQGLGTSMLQVPNILKNFWILVPPTFAAAVLGPMSTMLLGMTNIPSGAGMGTSGLVGQIGTFTAMGFSLSTLWKILIAHILLPALLSYVSYLLLVKFNRIKPGDMKLDV